MSAEHSKKIINKQGEYIMNEKNTKVISVINFKGGVGKTTVTFNLGAELHKRGNRILLIDFDGQGNLTKCLLGETTITDTIITSLNDVAAGREITVPIYEADHNLDVIPCNITKQKWTSDVMLEMQRETILKRFLDPIKNLNYYDYILVDNAPSISVDYQNSLIASDGYIIVAEPEVSSLDGITNSAKVINQIKNFYRPDLECVGILINNVDGRYKIHKDVREIISKSWGEDKYIFNTVIPRSVDITQAEACRQAVCYSAPDSAADISISNVATEFEERMR